MDSSQVRETAVTCRSEACHMQKQNSPQTGEIPSNREIKKKKKQYIK